MDHTVSIYLINFTKSCQTALQNGCTRLHFDVHENTWFSPTFAIRVSHF